MIEHLLTIIEPLCNWYERNHRQLPWRENPTPYQVWISEIMLQQTRVEAVKPYFHRFMEHLPSIEHLAQVEDDELLKLWQGLGYYSRARNLKKAAKTCIEQYNGTLPDSYEELLKLPGIGNYTAGAIASIAYHISVPAVDGNVLRVVSRILASKEDVSSPKVKKNIEQLLQNVIDTKINQYKDCSEKSFQIGMFNQALMELGATVCIPNGVPLCEKCPIHQMCLAYHRKETEQIPYKAPKKQRRIEEKTIFIVCVRECEDLEEKILLHKREQKGMLAGLYEFPNTENLLHIEDVKKYWMDIANNEIIVEEIGMAKHIFTHVQWNMVGYKVRLSNKIEMGENWIWATRNEIKTKFSIPSAFQFIMESDSFE